MTAWQDQPPLSRRQARQNERGGSADGPVDLVRSSGEQPDFGGFARAGWEADARRVAAPSQQNIPEQHDPEQNDPQQQQTTTGDRRALRAIRPEQAEPLGYAAQSLPQPQNDSGQNFRRRSVAAVPDQPEPAADAQPGYRVRDFSPEGRRTSFSATAPEPWWASPAPVNLDYRTQGAPVSSAAVTPAAPVAPAEEHTLTRRELRALEQNGRSAPVQFDAYAPGVPSRAEPDAQATPQAPAPEPGIAPTATPQAYAPPMASPAATPPPAAAPAAAAAAPVSAFDTLFAPILDQPGADVPVSESAPPAPIESAPDVFPLRLRDRIREPAPDDQARAAAAFAEFDELTEAETAASAVPPEAEPAAHRFAAVPPPAPAGVSPFEMLLTPTPNEPSTLTPPRGHWSTQASIDDDEQVHENTLSRNVGVVSGAITANALVIPSLPSAAAFTHLGTAGEILITGSIDLPRGMGETGIHPGRYDHPDVDTLFEQGDREDSDSDSAPVRAIRAVSTHASTRGAVEGKKPRGNSRLTMILAASAAAMAVGVVVLVVGGLIFGIFK